MNGSRSDQIESSVHPLIVTSGAGWSGVRGDRRLAADGSACRVHFRGAATGKSYDPSHLGLCFPSVREMAPQPITRIAN